MTADSRMYAEFRDADLIEDWMNYFTLLEVKRRLKPLNPIFRNKVLLGGGRTIVLTSESNSFNLVFRNNTLLYNNRFYRTRLDTENISDKIREIYRLSVERHGTFRLF